MLEVILLKMENLEVKKYYAVITGSITKKDDFLSSYSNLLPPKFQTFNLGFQGVVELPEALRDTLKIYLSLRLKNIISKISIGIGEVEFLRFPVGESDGEAFRFSGIGLNNKDAISIITSWTGINNEFQTEFSMLNSLIHFWSIEQMEAMRYYLDGKTQHEIAKILNITQSAVNQRLKTANYDVIEKMLDRYETIILATTEKKGRAFKSSVGDLPSLKRERRNYCERCRTIPKRLKWHHWDDNYTNLGIWVCDKCHFIVEETERNKNNKEYVPDERYILLKSLAEHDDLR